MSCAMKLELMLQNVFNGNNDVEEYNLNINFFIAMIMHDSSSHHENNESLPTSGRENG